MDNESLRTYLADFHGRHLPALYPRQVTLALDSKRIQTVIGARRSGKTYLLYDTMRRIAASGTQKKSCLYLNLEHPMLDGLTFKDGRYVVETYSSQFPIAGEYALQVFIDEPQVMNKWETFVRGLHDDGHRVYITGSSSRLLSMEIATSLRGRSLTKILLPLSLREFIDFKKVDGIADANLPSTQGRAHLRALWNEFFMYGGYPEVVQTVEETQKAAILKDYLDMTIYKDVIERYGVRNSSLVRRCIRSVIGSVSQQFNTNKLFLMLKSQGLKITKNTLYEYFSILQDCFFTFALHRYDMSLRKEDSSIPKVYLDDVGFLNLFSSGDDGRRLENIVFLELMRRTVNDPLLKLNYWRSRDDKEVDFLISRSGVPEHAVQVCFKLTDPSAREREMRALTQCMQYFKLKESVVITADEEGVENVSGTKIQIVPAWKWMLGTKY